MAVLRQQAVQMLNTLPLPEEMIVDFIQRMQQFQQEQEAQAAKDKLHGLLSTFNEATEHTGKDEAFRKVKAKYGSLSKALSGIVPPHLDEKTERDIALRQKYETID